MTNSYDLFPPDLKRVKAGDWDHLIQHIEHGGTITDEMRKFIVDVLRGKKTRPNNRPAKAATLRRYREVSNRVTTLEMRNKLTTTRAVTVVAGEENVEPRTVYRMIKGWRDYTATLPAGSDTDGDI
jgi:hypothetical protein